MNMHMHRKIMIVTCLLFSFSMYAQSEWTNDFSSLHEKLKTVGRGECRVVDGLLRSKGSYALFGKPEWKDYMFSFRARTPKEAEQVQIWAGFRTYNRFDRYVVGLKGGIQDDIYLMRSGYMGSDEFLGVRPLGFHPVPGEWYKIRVEICGNRIRVFVDDEKLPHIDVIDKNAHLVPAGQVSLGGGWIETEYDDLIVKPMDADSLKNIEVEEYCIMSTPQEKEIKRHKEREKYRPIKVEKLKNSRTEISLDGDWLFMPDYLLPDDENAVLSSSNDDDWHVLSVPNFWNPIRIWLHGETMPSPSGQQHKGVSDTYYQQETERCENYTFDYHKTGSAWYRQWIVLPNDLENKRMTLTFDAVSKAAEVYVNGQFAGTHIGMFGDFQMDVTNLLNPGKNLIVVKVIRDLDSSTKRTSDVMEHFYSSVRKDLDETRNDLQSKREVLTDIPHGFFGGNPAGIWQPVKLVISNHLKIEDVFIKSALDGATFEVAVTNSGNKKRKYVLLADIIDKKTNDILFSGQLMENLHLGGGEQQILTCKIDGLKPKLWEPASPNLYDFNFKLQDGDGKLADLLCITSGFRTFESKNGFLYLNGRKYWLRGGNHIPFALRPNDLQLANHFMQLMKDGNINSTRTHTTPWNELWLSAADRNGIAVSFEGTWPWLMIHSTPIPNQSILDLWSGEWLQLMKKYKNHPSIIFWTVNNEMKFYDLDADKERSMQKFQIISKVVKDMRKVDPTRPICFDSNYMRRSGIRRFGDTFFSTVDDGDIDDNHGYYNWYDYSLFRFFNGEFQKQFKTPGRPLISQEMSTGYPNAETGHPTRSYQLIHQNPFSLIGYEAYDWRNPDYFLKVQSFITGELAETLRRTNDQAAGIMHFAYMTWFRQCYDFKNILPYPTYFAMQRAMQPVLVSAELWGRNFYAGEKILTRIYVVNDSEDGRDLKPMTLKWKIVDADDRELASGKESFPAVAYYCREYIVPDIQVPNCLTEDKLNAKLMLQLEEEGNTISRNEYELLLANKNWNIGQVKKGEKILLLDEDGMNKKLDFLQIDYKLVTSVKELLNSNYDADLCIVSGLTNCNVDEKLQMLDYQGKGGKFLFINSNEVVKMVYPEYITGWVIPTEGDIVVMERDDHSSFNEIEPLELRYFNNNKREIPLVCNANLKVLRHEKVKELASQMKIHAYIDDGKPEDRINRIESMRGLTLLQIVEGKGLATVSTMCIEKADTDPVAGRLLVNLINGLLE